MAAEMFEQNIGYQREFQNILELIKNTDEDEKIDDDISFPEKEKPSKRKKGSRPEKTTHQKKSPIPADSKALAGLDVPTWARSIYKRIIKLTHPDKLLHLSITALDHERRKKIGMEASEFYSKGDWNNLLLLGVSVDIFTDELSFWYNKISSLASRCFYFHNSILKSSLNHSQTNLK